MMLPKRAEMTALQSYFADKTIVITGAASGIGQDLALLFASYGARLALSDLRPEPLDAVGSACKEAGAEVLVVAADVSDAAAMEGIAAQVFHRWEQADLVIANAGMGGLNPADAFDTEIHHRTVAVNALGLANTVAPFIPDMVARRSGHLACVASLAAFRGLPNAASYSSTKAYQSTFMESLRVDLRKHGVAVTCLYPGFVRTPMTDHDAFDMPFMVPVRQASLLMARALMRRRARYLFPWQMRWLTLLNRMLPCWLFDRLVPRLSGQPKQLKARTF